MTEKEYRELMGTVIEFHVLIEFSCPQAQYVGTSQTITDAGLNILKRLHTTHTYSEIALFTGNDDTADDAQLSLYYASSKLYIGAYDYKKHLVKPYITEKNIVEDNLRLQLQALYKRIDRLVDWPSQITCHVTPLMSQTWKQYLSQWPQLEQQYRSEWTIVDQISPKTPEAFQLAKEILEQNNAIYIESQIGDNKILYLTTKAKQCLDIARENEVFRPVYEQMLNRQQTEQIVQEIYQHSDLLNILDTTDTTITAYLTDAKYKNVILEINTQDKVITAMRYNKMLLTSMPEQKLTDFLVSLNQQLKKSRWQGIGFDD